MSAIQQLLTDHIDIWTAAHTGSKSGRGRSSSNAVSVYGITKLRELILELAVRGKLVPQDANDEPASKLLNRIQAEKTKLIKKGKIKKQKPQLPIAEDEKPFNLANGWEWLRLDDISPMSLIDGDWIESRDQDPKGDIRLVQLADIGVGEFKDKSDRFINQETFERLNCTQLETGDILIARLPSPIGRACLFPDANQMAITVVDVAILRSLGMFCDEYVVNAINSKTFRDQVEVYGKGATRFRVATGNLKSLLVPIPPIEEQHRIIAKVGELMALCDQLESQHTNAFDAHENLVGHLLSTLAQSQSAEDFSTSWQRIAAHFDTLFTTEASIDALKQTLLQLAVMGKLVPQYANDEPASELLKRIQAEKDKLIAEGKIKKDKSLSPISEDDRPFALPQGWEWVTLDEISQVGTGATPLRTTSEYFNPAIISWVTSGETSNPYIFETEQYVSPLALKETNLTVYPKGTLIVAMYGQGKTRGQVTELMIEACTNQACAAIRLINSDEFHRKYVKLFFEKIYDEIRELAAGGAQPNLNLSKIKETFLPLPPIPEQHRIVAKVDELIALCDRLKSRINDASQLQQKLADVVVEQAAA
jgi:type I restriction enzyme S subunit